MAAYQFNDVLSDQHPLLNTSDGKQGGDPALAVDVMHRPCFAHAEVDLKDGEKVVSVAGAMMWADQEVGVSTACHNGCATACCRTCAGESCCFNTFSGPGRVAFGFDLPGDILPFKIEEGAAWVVSSGSFVCATPNAKVSARFTGCGACLCGGEGAFFTEISSTGGEGVFYAGGFGALKRHEIAAGKTLFINDGLFFAANATTGISVEILGGCKTCCFGAEGFVMKIQGPAVVFTQNRDPDKFNALLNPRLPQGGGGGAGDAAGAAAGGPIQVIEH